MKQSYDFTAGPIGRPLLLYTLPLLLANVLQSFYQLVDLLVVGRIVGETGLAAISSASTVCFLITSLGTGLTTGGMVRVAQQAGAKDTTGLEETAGTLFSASLVVSLLVAVAGALTAPCLLQLLSVPSEAMTDASAYLRVLCLGTPLSFGYLAHSAFRKGTGDAKVPLLCIAAAAAINLLLDLLLVGILALGTVGAAYATVASQGASLLLSLSLGRGQDGAVSRRPRFTLRRQPLAAIVKIGLPTASNGGGKPLLLRLSGYVQHIRRVCRRRGRHRAEGKYLGRHAVLVPGPGGNRHGGAEHRGGRHGPCAENHLHGPLVRSGQHPDSPAAGTPFFSSHSPAVWIRQPGGPLRRGSLLSDLLRRQQPVLHCHVPP